MVLRHLIARSALAGFSMVGFADRKANSAGATASRTDATRRHAAFEALSTESSTPPGAGGGQGEQAPEARRKEEEGTEPAGAFHITSNDFDGWGCLG